MKKGNLSGLLIALGIGLVALSAGMLIFSQVSQKMAADQARKLVVQLRQLMPAVQEASPDDRINVEMASMEVDGANFCGILEIPAYNADLPIGASWNTKTLRRYPCRLTGGIYNGSLILGGSDNAGQLDFMQQITGGEKVYVTDMTGNRYRCAVSDVYRTKSVTTEYLMELDADLVLFAKNTYSLDYTLVLCKFG